MICMWRALIILPITRHKDTKSQCRNYFHLARAKYFTFYKTRKERRPIGRIGLQEESRYVLVYLMIKTDEMIIINVHNENFLTVDH